MEGIAYAESFQLRRQAGTASGGDGGQLLDLVAESWLGSVGAKEQAR